MLYKIACSSPSPQKLIKRTVKLICQKTPFPVLINKLADATRLYKPTKPCPTNIVAAVYVHAQKLQACLCTKPSEYILVATIASLLTFGLDAQGVVIYPKIPWFVRVSATSKPSKLSFDGGCCLSGSFDEKAKP